jgi:hypothetical protein
MCVYSLDPSRLTRTRCGQGEAILHSFVFPDSRAQFADLVRSAGLAKELENCLGRAFSAADVDFWSYADNLDTLGQRLSH